MFKKILVSFDGTKPSIAAVEKATDLAILCGAKMTILRAVQNETEEGAGFEVAARLSGTVVEDSVEEERESAIRSNAEAGIMDDTSAITQKAVDAGIEVTYAAIPGDPKTAIGAFAVGGHYDLIVMGHRVLSGFGGMVGSVSQRVAREVDIPILLVR